jgi:hypothetical protein
MAQSTSSSDKDSNQVRSATADQAPATPVVRPWARVIDQSNTPEAFLSMEQQQALELKMGAKIDV